MDDIKDFLEEKIGESHIVEDILTDYHRSESRKIMREKVFPDLKKAYYIYEVIHITKSQENYIAFDNIGTLAICLNRAHIMFLNNNFGWELGTKLRYIKAVQTIYVKEDLTYHSSSPIFIKNKKYYQ